jgi:hypothetical protein
MKSFYSDYVNTISDILDKKPKQRSFSAGSHIEKGFILNEATEAQNFPAVKSSQLPLLFGEPVGYKSEATIGTHPNFISLKFGEKRYQYCTSMFIDIKGSTNLSLSYSLEEVRMMKDAILSLCIQTVTVFGGHVQRLQGDGLYVQFTERQIHQNNMMINALNAASVLCQFVSTTLADIFEQRNLKPLRIKVGIDFAEEFKCLWSHYGLPGCNELTATSLHVDLAAKLQARCASNEIRIGQYIKQFLDLPAEFLKVPVAPDGKEDTYIKRAANYRQYIFDWQAYLITFDFVKKGNNRLELAPSDFSLSCCVLDETGKEIQYFQNNGAIPKGCKLRFQLMRNGSPYSKTKFDALSWRIVNRGEEATKANVLEEKLECYKDKTIVEVDTAYLGHHYMECVLKRTYENNNRRIKFGVYVR